MLGGDGGAYISNMHILLCLEHFQKFHVVWWMMVKTLDLGLEAWTKRINRPPPLPHPPPLRVYNGAKM